MLLQSTSYGGEETAGHGCIALESEAGNINIILKLGMIAVAAGYNYC